jgi:hypothetical protein
MPAGLRQLLTQNREAAEEHYNKDEDREPTPATHPPLFEKGAKGGQAVWLSKASREIWTFDAVHNDHYERLALCAFRIHSLSATTFACEAHPQIASRSCMACFLLGLPPDMANS